jgi:hypothetical protein
MYIRYLLMYLHLFQGTGNVGKFIISLQAFSTFTCINKYFLSLFVYILFLILEHNAKGLHPSVRSRKRGTNHVIYKIENLTMTNKDIHLQVYRFSKLSIRLLVFPFLTSLKLFQYLHYFSNFMPASIFCRFHSKSSSVF